jgi:bacterioferritin-associated ferredoxin
MAPAFVFVEQVRKAIRSGEKRLDLPQGARITAAAMELIKDHGIEIHYSSLAKTPSSKVTGEETVSGVVGSVKKGPSQADSKKIPKAEDGDIFSEEVVEDIVNRVIDRFNQIKGNKPGGIESVPPRPGTQAPADTKTDVEKEDDLVICRCEEITKEEIRDTIRNGFRTLNGIKRVTRAGMGLCQGQTCQQLITRILAEELGVKPAEIEPTTARGPVRPIRLAVFANS